MNRIRVHSRVPKQRDRDFVDIYRQLETSHSGPQVLGLPLRYDSNQVCISGKCDGGRKTADDDRDLAFGADLFQCLIDRTSHTAATRNPNMPGDSEPLQINFAFAKRVAAANDPDETVAE